MKSLKLILVLAVVASLLAAAGKTAQGPLQGRAERVVLHHVRPGRRRQPQALGVQIDPDA